MGISIWQLLILLGIIVLLFGTKKLGNIGTDLGNAIKGFKNAMKSGEQEEANSSTPPPSSHNSSNPTPLNHQSTSGSRIIEVSPTRENDRT